MRTSIASLIALVLVPLLVGCDREPDGPEIPGTCWSQLQVAEKQCFQTTINSVRCAHGYVANSIRWANLTEVVCVPK